MRSIFIVVLVAVAAWGSEREACKRLAPRYHAKTEVRLWDSTRVDLLNAEYAIEVDWPEKWAEAIGQSLYYAALTDRKPGIILLVDNLKDQSRYVYRCQTICEKYDIKLWLEYVE
jgi:hypothetical protein